jgi:hypothetical protein
MSLLAPLLGWLFRLRVRGDLRRMKRLVEADASIGRAHAASLTA